jgi:hypothetical protein
MVCDSPRARRVVIGDSRITEWFEEPSINGDGNDDDPYGENRDGNTARRAVGDAGDRSMTEVASGPDETSRARGVPLLVTAELPPDILEWADGLRQAHYPSARNRLHAHVTLFHALPPSAYGEVRQLLAGLAGETDAPVAQITGLMDLGKGTAFTLDSPGMIALHERLAELLHGLTQQKDTRELRLHITVQNKVPPGLAKSLQAELAAQFRPRSFRFRGFGLYGWDGLLWNFERLYRFRG